MPDIDLEDLFLQARAAAPLPSAGLVARIEADAEAEQARRVGGAAPARKRPSVWARFVAALGGGGVLAGLATTTLAGVWVGMAEPAPLSVLTDKVSVMIVGAADYDQIELIPADDPFLTEG